MQINELLRFMVEKDASDLHIRVGSPPMFRLFGKLSVVKDWPPITIEDTESIFESITTPTLKNIR